MYTTKIYCIPLNDVTGNCPQRSVLIVPLIMSPRTAKRYIESSSAVHSCCGKCISLTAYRALKMSCSWSLVHCTSLLCQIMWPLSVAVDGGRCFLMRSWVRPGSVLNCRLAIPRRSAICVGEYTLWWWYFANSSIFVVGVRLHAHSSVVTFIIGSWRSIFWQNVR